MEGVLRAVVIAGLLFGISGVIVAPNARARKARRAQERERRISCSVNQLAVDDTDEQKVDTAPSEPIKIQSERVHPTAVRYRRVMKGCGWAGFVMGPLLMIAGDQLENRLVTFSGPVVSLCAGVLLEQAMR